MTPERCANGKVAYNDQQWLMTHLLTFRSLGMYIEVMMIKLQDVVMENELLNFQMTVQEGD